MCVCVCAVRQRTGQQAQVQQSPGVPLRTTQWVRANMEGPTSKWRGIGIREHTRWAPVLSAYDTLIIDGAVVNTCASKAKTCTHTYQSVRINHSALCTASLRHQTTFESLQLFTFSLPSLPFSDLPLSSSVSVSLGSESGIKRKMGGCDLQQNPLSLALPHTSQSAGEVLIHRTAQSC